MIFGWDISNYDVDRGLTGSEVRAGYGQGIRFFTAKSTEHSPNGMFRHHDATRLLNVARDTYPFFGHYIVPRSGVPIETQGRTCLAHLDQHIPWWREHRNFFHQVDLELWPYDKVAPSVGLAVADWLSSKTGQPVVIYASGGQYGNGPVTAPYPRWNARYPLNYQAGDFRDLYRRAEAVAEGKGWLPAGTVIWQYTSSARIGSQSTCDANVFRGTEGDFARVIFKRKPIPPPQAPPIPLAARAILGREV